MSSSSISPKPRVSPLASPLPGVRQMPWSGWYRMGLSLRCDCTRPLHAGKRRRRTNDPTLPPEADAAGDDAQVADTIMGEPILAVFKAIWKHVGRKAGGLEPVFFGPAEAVPLPLSPTQGRTYALRLIFAEQDEAKLLAWQEALQKHLQDPKYNYTVMVMELPEWRTWEMLMAEPLEIAASVAEVCLDFLTPMSFNKPVANSGLPAHPWLLTEAELKRRVAERWLLATGERPDLKALPALEVRPWFWDFVRTRHVSKSQGGHFQFYAGCQGPLYIRGDWQAWLPWWRWLQEWGLGKETSNGLGCFSLSTERTHFDRLITDPDRYQASLQGLLEDAEGMDQELTRLAMDLPGACKAMASAIKTQTYEPGRARGFLIPKKDGGQRLITEPAATDQVVMHALHRLLQEPLDRQLEDACHGYRPGRGVDSACAAFSRHLRAGMTHVLEADIEAFFDEMDWGVLEETLGRVLPRADARTRSLLSCLVRLPLEVKGLLVRRDKGVLQGAALSPLLANLYLDSFDEAMTRSGFALVRYGDDIRILGQGETACRLALAKVQEFLRQKKLRLKDEKTRIQPADLGLTYLGRNFGMEADAQLIQRGLLKTPLWISNDWSFIGLEADTVILRRDKVKVGQYPLLRISEVVLQGTHSVSTSLLMRCSRQGIPVSFCRAGGEYVNTLIPSGETWPKMGWRHIQRHQALPMEERLEICRELVAAKLGNYCGWFKQKRQPPPVVMEHILQRLRQAGSVMEIMGVEGEASRQIFRRVNGLAHDESFVSVARVQRQKPDRWNCLLDASYMLLFHHLHVLVRNAALNPWLGFLHSPENRYESLVCDLQEPFRHRIDRLVLNWIRLRSIQAEHFELQHGRWSLTQEGRGALLRVWHAALHSGYAGDENVSLAGWLQRQVLWLENWVSHGGGLPCYRIVSS